MLRYRRCLGLGMIRTKATLSYNSNLTVSKHKPLLPEIADILKRSEQENEANEISFELRNPFSENLERVPKELVEKTGKPPLLEHDLKKCLYQPMNIFPLRDTRTDVFNFTPFLEYLIDVDNFNFDGISQFTPPSKDKNLLEIAKKMDKSFFSSTSSMTGILSQLHFLISNFRPLNMNNLSHSVSPKYNSFTLGARSASTVIMKRMGTKSNFAITSDKSINKDIILSRLGHCLETLLTTSKPEFNRCFNKKGKNVQNLVKKAVDHYHYSTIGDFILRSQLDAYDPNLPGTGVFDLKTRAVAAIRHDIAHIENNDNYTGYEIKKRYGQFESFEREYYELIRSTMLKYSLQARIGDMDGIFVAYHNISKMFGFQYIPLEEMNYILHSNVDIDTTKKLAKRDELLRVIYGENKFMEDHVYEANQYQIAQKIAQAEFNFSMRFLSQLFKNVKKTLSPNQHARIMFKTRSKDILCDPQDTSPTLYVFVTPINDNQLDLFEDNQLQHILAQGDADSISRYTKEIEMLHARLLPKTSCFVVKIKHDFNNNFKEFKDTIPYYSSVSHDSKAYFEDHLENSSAKWKHPYFHYPSEVDNWTVDFDIKPFSDRSRISWFYKDCLDEQLSLLRTQSIPTTEPSDRSLEAIKTKLDRLIEGKHVDQRKSFGKENDADISTLQAILRAISKKNGLRKTKNVKKGKRIMWNEI